MILLYSSHGHLKIAKFCTFLLLLANSIFDLTLIFPNMNIIPESSFFPLLKGIECYKFVKENTISMHP